MKAYIYKIGSAYVVTHAEKITLMVVPGVFHTVDGRPIDDVFNGAPGIAKRKPGKKKAKPREKREIKATCPKCDRVFFQNQGVKQHIKHCKGRRGE